jgi:3-hexulose-6-phosphate synthase
MKLQLALDRLTREQCWEIVAEVQDLIDILEIGTGVIKQYGVGIITDLQKSFQTSNLRLLADMKTCDAGKHETVQALSAGANITTVMAFSDERTIEDSLEVARQSGGQVMIDLLGVHEEKTIVRLYDLGARLFSVHIGKDMQGNRLEEQRAAATAAWLHKLEGAEFAYAGGVSANSIETVAAYRPDIIIVGSAITGAVSHRDAAQTIRKKMNEAYETFA